MQPPVVDTKRLLQSGLGDQTRADHLLLLFSESLPCDVRQIERHLEARAWVECSMVVHSVRGAASNLGILRLEAECAAFEALLDNYASLGLAKSTRESERCFDAVEKEIIDVIEYTLTHV